MFNYLKTCRASAGQFKKTQHNQKHNLSSGSYFGFPLINSVNTENNTHTQKTSNKKKRLNISFIQI